MRRNNVGRGILTSILTGVLAVGTNSGCSMSRPVYDKQGRYVGEEKVADEGRNLATWGAIIGGVPGWAAWVLGNRMSEEQKQIIEVEHRRRTQDQIDRHLAPAKQGNHIPLRTRPITSSDIANYFSPTTNSEESSESPVKIELSSTFGIAPLLISYSAAFPEGLAEKSYLWALNGEMISKGREGQLFVKTAGKHKLSLVVTDDDGQRYFGEREVTVLERITFDRKNK